MYASLSGVLCPWLVFGLLKVQYAWPGQIADKVELISLNKYSNKYVLSSDILRFPEDISDTSDLENNSDSENIKERPPNSNAVPLRRVSQE